MCSCSRDSRVAISSFWHRHHHNNTSGACGPVLTRSFPMPASKAPRTCARCVRALSLGYDYLLTIQCVL